jgi:TP901 family phage tail tape measure protein
MAKGDDYINIGMGLDITELKAGLQDAKSQLKLAESEFKKNTSALDAWGESAEGVLEQVLLLTEKISYQEKQMAATRAEIERAKEQYGEASNKVRDLTAKLNDQEAYLNKLKSQLGGAREKLGDLSTGESLAGKSADELAASVSNLKTRLSDQEVVLGQLRLKLDGVVAQYGEGSAQAQALNTEIGVQEQKLRDITDTLEAYESALDGVGDEAGQAASGLDDMGDEMDEASSKSKGLDGAMDTLKDKLQNLAKKGIGMAVDALKDFIKQTIQLGIDFSSTMSSVQAITGASADEMAELEKAARDAGASTTFSAQEAGEALKYMALAGWDSGQSVSALGGILDLAAASGMGLAEASDAVTDYLTAFGMEAKESTRLADLLSYAQANANTSVDQLVAAYKNSAVTMAANGQSIEQVTAALATMSNAGLKGGEAGTALNAVMRDMTRKMQDGSIQIGDASVAILDAGGSFRSLGDILHDIGAATDSMSEGQRATALQMTFTTESIKGLNAMLGQGSGAVNDFADSLSGSGGAAKEMAAIMTDNLGGDIKQLNSTLDEIKLALFDLIEGPLRAIVQALTEILKHSDGVADGIAKNFQPVIDQFSSASKGVDALKNADWDGIAAKAKDTWSGIEKAFSGAGEWFDGLGKEWKAIFEAGWTEVKNVFSGVGDFFAKVVEAVKKPFEPVVKWFSALFGGGSDKGGEGVLGAIKKPFSGVGEFFEGVWAKVKAPFAKAEEWASKLVSGIKSPFYGISSWFKETFTNAWNAAKNVMSNPGEFFSGVLAKVKGAFSGITSWFKETFTSAWSAAKGAFSKPGEWASGVYGSVKSGFFGITSWFKDTFSGAWDAAKGAFSKVGDFFSDVLAKVKSPFSGVTKWFGDLFGGTTISTGVIGAIKKPFDGIEKFFSGVWADIKKPFDGVVSFFKKAFGGGLAAEGAVDAIKKPFSKIGDYFSDVWAAIKKPFSDVTSYFKGLFGGTLTSGGVIGAIKKPFDGIAKFFEGVYDSIIGPFKPIIDFFKKLFGGKTDGKGDNADTAGAVGAIRKPFSALSGFFSGKTGVVDSIANAFSGIPKYFSDVFSAAVGFIHAAFDGIGQWFTKNVMDPIMKSIEDATSAGNNISVGMAQGITANSNAVSKASTGLAGIITDAVCGALGIHSPSTVMRDKVGLMIGAGIVEGMKDSELAGVKEAARWSKSVSDGLSLAVDTSRAGLASGLGAQPTQVITYNQTINSPEPLSAGEIYRDTRSLIGRRTWA